MKLDMAGRLEDCVLLAYRTPATSVRRLLPPPLEPVTCGEWAFWNVMACRIGAARAKGMPRALGIGYRHVAYRVYVTAPLADGSRLDGLYFVRSDADSRLVSAIGNALSDLRFHPARIRFAASEERVDIEVEPRAVPRARGLLRARATPAARLAAGSPFATLAEAERVLTYRPAALHPDASRTRLRLVEVLRPAGEWRERPIAVLEARWSFLESLGQIDLHLERATRADPIDYRWRLGCSVALAPS